MQPSEIISVNVWQIVVSLLNLLILFFILKRFLFKPVKKTLESRNSKINGQFEQAEKARSEAERAQRELNAQLDSARERANEILNEASELADARIQKAKKSARDEAEAILRQARADAELERKRAQAKIKEQIVEVSSALAEKLIEREISEKDHRDLIDSFIEDMPHEK